MENFVENRQQKFIHFIVENNFHSIVPDSHDTFPHKKKSVKLFLNLMKPGFSNKNIFHHIILTIFAPIKN